MRRFRGALPALGAFLLSAAVEIGDYNSRWLSIGFFIVGVALLSLWAAPFFWQEWEHMHADVEVQRLLEQFEPTSLSVDDVTGLVTANCTVTGRMWFEKPVVMDEIYVVFTQRRRGPLWFFKQEVVRGHPTESWLERKVVGGTYNEMRLEAGSQLRFDKTLFSVWQLEPCVPPTKGKFWAELYIDLLVPRKTIRANVRDEARPSRERNNSGRR